MSLNLIIAISLVGIFCLLAYKLFVANTEQVVVYIQQPEQNPMNIIQPMNIVQPVNIEQPSTEDIFESRVLEAFANSIDKIAIGNESREIFNVDYNNFFVLYPEYSDLKMNESDKITDKEHPKSRFIEKIYNILTKEANKKLKTLTIEDKIKIVFKQTKYKFDINNNDSMLFFAFAIEYGEFFKRFPEYKDLQGDKQDFIDSGPKRDFFIKILNTLDIPEEMFNLKI